MDDAVATKDWLGQALIQRIDFQTGICHIWIEPGYSVFRIYPYLSKSSPQPRVYQGIVLKVKGTLSVDDLVAAIRSRTPTVKIDEYDVFGADNASIRNDTRDRTTKKRLDGRLPRHATSFFLNYSCKIAIVLVFTRENAGKVLRSGKRANCGLEIQIGVENRDYHHLSQSESFRC